MMQLKKSLVLFAWFKIIELTQTVSVSTEILKPENFNRTFFNTGLEFVDSSPC